jgi:hypothetical protein
VDGGSGGQAPIPGKGGGGGAGCNAGDTGRGAGYAGGGGGITLDSATGYWGSGGGGGSSFVSSHVDLGIPDAGSRSVMWVAVSASVATPSGATRGEFSVGDRLSPSTTINVI